MHETELWRTPEEIFEARDRLERRLGWRRPAVYGIGWARDTQPEASGAGGTIDQATIVRYNVGEHYLPAVVLATVLGHRDGSRAYRLTPAQLQEAVEALAPAEACTAFEHPNLWAWRAMVAEPRQGRSILAIFVTDLGEPCADPYAEQLRRLAHGPDLHGS